MTVTPHCRVCGSPTVTHFLTRKQVPVHQNLLLSDKQAALGVARGDLTLLVCQACGFIWNETFDPTRLNYGPDYDNTQTCSPSFLKYLDGIVEDLLLREGVRNCTIAEIGCGKGAFLRKLVEPEDAGNRGYGFDPSYEGPEVSIGGRLTIKKTFYGPEHSSVSADVAICRHVIEHVPDPVQLLSVIRSALITNTASVLFLETPCAEWILANRVVWDFFYEHCSYFSAASLATALELAGFKVERVQHRFGGQYLWAKASIQREPSSVTKQRGLVPDLAHRFGSAEASLTQTWVRKIADLGQRGNVALWGAGAKGVTLANLIDPEGRSIACIVDLNPNKQGRFVPGSGHPIISHEDLAAYNVKNILLMNSIYYDENLSLLRTRSCDVSLLRWEDL